MEKRNQFGKVQQGTDSSTVRNCAASEFLLAVANTLDEGTTSYSERAVAVAAAAATRFSSKKETTSRAEQQASL